MVRRDGAWRLDLTRDVADRPQVAQQYRVMVAAYDVWIPRITHGDYAAPRAALAGMTESVRRRRAVSLRPECPASAAPPVAALNPAAAGVAASAAIPLSGRP